MLHMCICMHSRFVENHPIRILKDRPLISEVVLSHCIIFSKMKSSYISSMEHLPGGDMMTLLMRKYTLTEDESWFLYCGNCA
jgi:hypothetical protein